jgi:arabinose-5-phosphate isomerase
MQCGAIKGYNIKDGMGISKLIKANIEVGVISGWNENDSQKSILKHLNISRISFGSNDKITVLKKWCEELNISLNDVAYMGDDINDLCILNIVGLSGCPNDAVVEVINCIKFKSNKNGGCGCIREFCDHILNTNIQTDSVANIVTEIKTEFYHQINNFNLNDIEKVAYLINNNKHNIYVMGVGKSGNIAKHMGDLLKCISYPCFYLDILNLTHGDIGTITKDDLILCFSNSGNTQEIINIIPIIKNVGSLIIGICCNPNSSFKELCNETIVLPFNNEISGEIDKIPTNSYMSFLLFSNILVSILKKNISLEKYKHNHTSGRIGQSLLKVNDVLITEYPKLVVEKDTSEFSIISIFVEMSKYNIGCCFFVDSNNILIGILTDGDIRRYLCKNVLNNINCSEINTNYYYINNKDLRITDIMKIGTGITPIVSSNKKLEGYIDI